MSKAYQFFSTTFDRKSVTETALICYISLTWAYGDDKEKRYIHVHQAIPLHFHDYNAPPLPNSYIDMFRKPTKQKKWPCFL